MSFKKPDPPVVQPAPAAAPAAVAAPTAAIATSPIAPVTAAPSFSSVGGGAPGQSATGEAVSKRKRQSTLLASAPSSAAANTLLGSPIK